MASILLDMNQDFYQSTKWKKKRKAILRRDKYQCQMAKRYGKIKEAETVHHIMPLEEFPEYALEDWNLIALSKEEHNRLHARETHELTEEGKKLQRRTLEKLDRQNCDIRAEKPKGL